MNEIDELQSNIRKLESQLVKAKRAQYLDCVKCGSKSQISLLEGRVIKFYVEPYSCTGGAYWTEGKDPEFQIFCPQCDKWVRYYSTTLNKSLDTKQKFIKANRYHFKR